MKAIVVAYALLLALILGGCGQGAADKPLSHPIGAPCFIGASRPVQNPYSPCFIAAVQP